jgi:nicotinate-nucleotide adenylyltransferase
LKIGIFGGSFDPVHKAHVKAALEVKKEFRLDEVIFVPLKKPVHKTECSASPEDRVKMLSLALGDYPFFSISLDEIERETSSYTFETLSHYHDKLIGCELFFITGSDSFNTFDNWRNPELIVQLAKIIVLNRPGFEINDKLVSKYGNVFKAKNSFIDISSSLIRSGDGYKYLDENVYNYIKMKGLYEIGS